MTPKERAVLALQVRQPDRVPHFELEMQLTEEYFGKHFVSREEWAANPGLSLEYLQRDADLLLQTASHFDYCIIFYSQVFRPGEEDYVRGIQVLRRRDNGRHLIMAHGDTTLSIPDGNTMEQLVFALVDHPDQVKAEQEKAVHIARERARVLLDAGLDGFILCSDYCFNTGPFLSPHMFAEFVTPFLGELVQSYRDLGALVIKHTDGNIMPILDQLASTRPHALHSLDPMAGVDLREIKQRYGHQFCLIGNVNCALMQTGTDEEILESCRYAMENGKPGGGFIFSTSNVIFKGMPPRSYDLMLDYYRRHCGY